MSRIVGGGEDTPAGVCILPPTQFYELDILKNLIKCLRRAQIFSYLIVP